MYIRIEPTDSALSPSAVVNHGRRLHSLDDQPTGWRRLFASPMVPIEWLIVGTGTDQLAVEYYVGHPDKTTGTVLQHILQGLFPDSYELEIVDRPELVAPSEDIAHEATAAAEVHGKADRRQDGQASLRSYDHFVGSEHARAPPATVVEAMAEAEVPMVYQVLLRPYTEWSDGYDERIQKIHNNRDTLAGKLLARLLDIPDDDARVDALLQRNPLQSFVLNARLLALTDENTASIPTSRAARAVENAAVGLTDVGTTTHRIDTRLHSGDAADTVYDAVQQRTMHQPGYERRATSLPAGWNTSRGIVVDPTEVPSFCVVDGDALTTTGERALSITPNDHTDVPRSPDD